MDPNSYSDYQNSIGENFANFFSSSFVYDDGANDTHALQQLLPQQPQQQPQQQHPLIDKSPLDLRDNSQQQPQQNFVPSFDGFSAAGQQSTFPQIHDTSFGVATILVPHQIDVASNLTQQQQNGGATIHAPQHNGASNMVAPQQNGSSTVLAPQQVQQYDQFQVSPQSFLHVQPQNQQYLQSEQRHAIVPNVQPAVPMGIISNVAIQQSSDSHSVATNPVATPANPSTPTPPKILVGKSSGFRNDATHTFSSTSSSPIAYGVVSSSQRSASTGSASTPPNSPPPKILVSGGKSAVPVAEDDAAVEENTAEDNAAEYNVTAEDNAVEDNAADEESASIDADPYSYHFCSFCNKPFADAEKCRAHEEAAHLDGSGVKNGDSVISVKQEKEDPSSASTDKAAPVVSSTQSANNAPKRKVAMKSTSAGPRSKKLKLDSLKCPTCSLIFLNDFALQKHIDVAHGQPKAMTTTTTTTTTSGFNKRCVYCGKTDFTSKRHFYDHLRVLHQLTVSQDDDDGANESMWNLIDKLNDPVSLQCPAIQCKKENISLDKNTFVNHMESVHYVKPTSSWVMSAEVGNDPPPTFKCLACKMPYDWKFVEKHLENTTHINNVAKMMFDKKTDDTLAKKEVGSSKLPAYDPTNEEDAFTANFVVYEKNSELKDILSAPKTFSCPACPPPTMFTGEYQLKLHIIKNHKGFFPTSVIETFAPGLVKIAKQFGYNVKVADDTGMLKKSGVKSKTSAAAAPAGAIVPRPNKPGPLSKKQSVGVAAPAPSNVGLAGAETAPVSSNPSPIKVESTSVMKKKPGPLSSKVSPSKVTTTQATTSITHKPGPLSSKSPENDLSDFFVPFKSPPGLPYSPVGMAHRCTWRCNLCGDIVSHRNNAKRHSIAKHDGIPNYTMLIDGKVVSSRQEKADYHKCAVCFEVFPSEVLLQNHRKEKHAASIPISPQVVPGFHPSNGTGFEKMGGYRCSLCPRREFASEYALHCHKNKMHPTLVVEKSKEGGSPKCHICETSFSTYSNLRRHLKLQHGMGDKKYRCEECKKEFWNLNNGRRHLVTHSNPVELKVIHLKNGVEVAEGDRMEQEVEEEENLVLEEEPSTSSSSTGLDSEMEKIVTPEFKCEKCNLGFPYESMLLLHYRRKHAELLSTIKKKKSTPQKPPTTVAATKAPPVDKVKVTPEKKKSPVKPTLQAPPKISDDALRKKFGLNTSRVKISASKLITMNCTECQENFLNREALQKHISEHHKNEHHKNERHKNEHHKTEQKIPCKSCEQIFTNTTCYKRHQNLVHTKGDDSSFFACPICNDGFDTRAGLSSHLSSEYMVSITNWLAHTPNKGVSFKCKTCLDQFPYSIIAQHVLSHDYKNDAFLLEEGDSESNDEREIVSKTHKMTPSKTPNKTVNASPRGQTGNCGVCGKGDSKLHYGEISCDACRKFYANAIEKKVTWVCDKGGNCEITELSRTCSRCRYEKCLLLWSDERARSQVLTSPVGKSAQVEVKKSVTPVPVPKSRVTPVPVPKSLQIAAANPIRPRSGQHDPVIDGTDCVVCGKANASPHYGTITCEACRMFFFLNYKENRIPNLFCKADKNCTITETSRSCAFCRFQICLEKGMDINYRPSVAAEPRQNSGPGKNLQNLRQFTVTSRKRINNTDVNVAMQIVQCSVCLSDAEDIYDDVPCCSLCLQFFRQYKDNAFNLKCLRNKLCDAQHIDFSTSGCPRCRIEKCVSVGMGKNSRISEKVSTASVSSSESNDRRCGKSSYCSVCSSKAEGRHYGVPCCTACKTFFYKNHKEGLSRLSCNANESCDLLDAAMNSKHCRLCRLNKCFQVGMGENQVSSSKTKDSLSTKESTDAKPVDLESYSKSTLAQDDFQPVLKQKKKFRSALSREISKSTQQKKFKPTEKLENAKPTHNPEKVKPIIKQEVTKSTSKQDNVNSENATLTTIDQCRICSRTADGTFYGVRACYRCKHCFGVYLSTKSKFVCRQDESCNVKDSRLTSNCRSCILAGCLKAGMARIKSRVKKTARRKLCLVCDRASAGVRYGVQACDGCRFFFCYNFNKGDVYKCQDDGFCARKGSDQLRKCRRCRLKKCLEVGMTKGGSTFADGQNLEITIIKSQDDAVKKIKSESKSGLKVQSQPDSAATQKKKHDNLLIKLEANEDGLLNELKTKINSVRRLSGQLAGYKSTKEFQKCLSLFKLFGRAMGGVDVNQDSVEAQNRFKTDLFEFSTRFKNLQSTFKKRMLLNGSRKQLGIYLREQAVMCYLSEKKRRVATTEPLPTDELPGSPQEEVQDSETFLSDDEVSFAPPISFAPKVISVSSVTGVGNPKKPIKRSKSPTTPPKPQPTVSNNSTFGAALSVINALIDTIVIDGDFHFYSQCAQLREGKPRTGTQTCHLCGDDGFETQDQVEHHKRLCHSGQRHLRVNDVKVEVRGKEAETVSSDVHRCNACEKTFKSADSLRHHNKDKHRSLSKPKPSRFPCPVCRKTYHDKEILEIHMEAIHGGKRFLKRAKYTCPCDSYYFSKNQFEEHLRFGHGVRVSKWSKRGKMPFSVKCFSCNQHYMWEFLSDHLATDIHKFYSTYFGSEPRVVLERITNVKKFVMEYNERMEDCRLTLDAIVDAVEKDEWKKDNPIGQEGPEECADDYGADNFHDMDEDDDKEADADDNLFGHESPAYDDSVDHYDHDDHDDDSFRLLTNNVNLDLIRRSSPDLDSDMCCEAEADADDGSILHSSSQRLDLSSLSTEYEDSTTKATSSEIACEKCGSSFAQRSSLYRHIRKARCKM